MLSVGSSASEPMCRRSGRKGIPNDLRAPVEGSFIKESMVSLSDLGRVMARDAISWTVWSQPE